MSNFKDDIEKNKMELSNDNLSEIEIASIKKEMRKRVSKGNKKTFKKVAVAVASIAVIGGGLPAIAQSIPALKEIYARTRMATEYKEYNQYVGEVKEFEGGTATLDNLIITRDRMMVLIEVKTEEKIPEGDEYKFYLMSHFDKEWNASSIGHAGSSYRVDDNTFMIEADLHWEGYDLKKNEEISFVIAYGDNKRVTKFDLKANVGNALDEVYDLELNEKINDEITLVGLDSTILATDLRFNKVAIEEARSREVSLYETILNVDGKYYFGESYGPSGKASSNEVTTEYRSLTKETLENAKSIEAIIFENTNINIRDENGELSKDLKVEYAQQDGIKYPKIVQTPKGSRVKYSNLKVTDDKISIDVESDNIDPILFAKNLYCGSYLNKRNISKIEKGYNVTFDKVEACVEDGYNIGIAHYGFECYDEMEIIDTIKIK